MQTVKYARTRVARQTARNIRYGFPQRGRYFGSINGGAIVLPLSAGHRAWGK